MKTSAQKARDIHLVEKFLLGSLSRVEVVKFHERLAQDQEFHALYLKARSEAAKKTNVYQPTENSGILTGIYLTTASVAILLLILSTCYWYVDMRYSNTALAQKYYEPPAFSPDQWAYPEADELQEAAEFFARAQIDSAFVALQNIPPNHADFQRGRYYAAHAMMQMDRPAVAVSIFNDLRFMDTEVTPEAKWFYVLSALHLNKCDSTTLEILDDIVDTSEHPHQSDGISLRQDLQHFLRRRFLHS